MEMIVHTHGMLIAALAASTAIAACSSGSTVSPVVERSGNTDAQQVLATDAGRAVEALDDGLVLRASERASSQWTRNFQADTASLSEDSSVFISRNDQGGLTLTIPGHDPIEFTEADLDPENSGFRLPDGSAGLWALNVSSLEEALDPTNPDYSIGFGYWADFDNGTGANGFALVGTETASAALENLPTATYTGRARANVAPSVGFNDYNEDVFEARGDVSLTANFGNGTVEGDITNMMSRPPNDVDPTGTWETLDGSLIMEQSNIVGNGFTGRLSGDAGFTAAVGDLDPGSTYSGTFFGPGAQEVGGGLNMTGTAPDGTPFLGFGFWKAFD